MTKRLRERSRDRGGSQRVSVRAGSILMGCRLLSPSIALFSSIRSIWSEEFNKRRANDLTRYPVISTDETLSLLHSLYSYSRLIGLWKIANGLQYSADLPSGNIEHDCASGSFALLFPSSPDLLVRKLIAIDTLLREVNCRITAHFCHVTVKQDFYFTFY